MCYDTALRGTIILPQWRYFGGCPHAIRRANLSRADQLRTYRVMAKWLLVPARFRAMSKDLDYAGKAHVVRSVVNVVPGAQNRFGDVSE